MVVVTERERPRRGFLRGIIILPSALTLGNLFFGFWAIISALRGDLMWAAWLVIAAGVADGIDGRVARFTRTGTGFGAQLDSLIDVISFGIAPAIILYTLFLAQGGEWAWVVCFIYVTSAALRLARFNVEQGGKAKVHFHGLPSPPAGMTLAVFYPFSQTDFFLTHLAGWPWKNLIVGLTIVIGALMVSHVLYPVIPRISWRTPRARIASLGWIAAAAVILFQPKLLFFPAGLAYITYGVAKAAWWGLMDRLPERDPLWDELESEDEETETREVEYEQMQVRKPWPWTRRRRETGSA